MRRFAPIHQRRATWILGWALSILLVVFQFARLPALVGLNGPVPAGVRLHFPWSYDLLAPFTVLADRLALLSARQWKALLTCFLLGWGVARLLRWPLWRPRVSLRGLVGEVARTAVLTGTVGLVMAWTAWWGRPMVALAIEDPDLVAVDFHSHTQYSRGARREFSPLDNMGWHGRAGFQASFITDHRSIEGSVQGRRAAEHLEPGWGRLSMLGEELRFAGLHVVELGCSSPMDPADPRGREGIGLAIARIHRCGGAVIASLPELRLHGERQGLEQLADWGIDGFEILSGTPQGLEFPPEGRERTVLLCRRRNLVAVSATDIHGYGSTVAAWNLMRIPGWNSTDARDLERDIILALRKGGPGVVTVLARPRLESPGWASLAFDPFLQIVFALRTPTTSQVLICLAWIWVPLFISRALARVPFMADLHRGH